MIRVSPWRVGGPLLVAALAGGAGGSACVWPAAPPSAVTYVDTHTLHGPRNFLTEVDLVNADGRYNMVVEIPTGTSDKWEVCTFDALTRPERFPGCTAVGREMIHEVKDGRRRVVHHLGYPGNYGAFPRTRAGDGDPLDVIAIGPAIARGTVVAVTVVGVVRCRDGGAQDDKLIAIAEGSPLHGLVSTAAQLEARAPRAADILHLWFLGYKGDDSMDCTPMAGEASAAAVLAEARDAFRLP